MKWFVGVDGGGSKTDFAVASADGIPVVGLQTTGCSHQSIGVEAVVQLLVHGVQQCLAKAGVQIADCEGCCIGLPCYGERAESDQQIAQQLQAALAPMSLCLVNDVEVGWAGSLECCQGIHLVAGTGAIAFGRGSDKKTARSGGWNEFFGDEGSCYWVGRQAMGLFSKEADGRLPRGALYHLVREQLSLADDYEFIDVILRDYAPRREQVATFQLYAERAALAGDTAARALYASAAQELVLLSGALKERLQLTGPAAVSYSGGLFRAGELILEPLRNGLEQIGCRLQRPKRTATEGALLLAIEYFNGRTK